MRIAITGPPGSGKTTLLKRVVHRIGGFRGFYTEEVREGGRRIGFKVIPIPEGEEFFLAAVDPRLLKSPGAYRVGRYIVDKYALERIVEILEEAMNSDRIAIDEIGKMELLNPRFRDIIVEILDSDADVILTYGLNIQKHYRKYIEFKCHVIELKKRGDAERLLPIVLSRFRGGGDHP